MHDLGIPTHTCAGSLPREIIDALSYARKASCGTCGMPMIIWRLTNQVDDRCGNCDDWADRVVRAGLERRGIMLVGGENGGASEA